MNSNSTAAQQMLVDKVGIARSLDESGIEPEQLPFVLRSAQGWAETLRAGFNTASFLAELVERVELLEGGVQITLKLRIVVNQNDELSLTGFIPVSIQRRGAEMRLVLAENNKTARVNLPLLKLVARAHRWAEELISGRASSIAELAKQERVDRRSVRRMLRLAFLGPAMVEAIAGGRQTPDLTARALTREIDLPLLWNLQERALRLN